MALEPFADAEVKYEELVEQRRRGLMDVRAFRSAVLDLTVQDGEGVQWVLGPGDGNWYRHDRERWIPAQPPRRLVCPHCGHHNLTRYSFCVECGRLLR
ncbi:MAG: zinc-ribbon domain-containing protein [Candidatus Dormibacteraceae bacterium]